MLKIPIKDRLLIRACLEENEIVVWTERANRNKCAVIILTTALELLWISALAYFLVTFNPSSFVLAIILTFFIHYLSEKTAVIYIITNHRVIFLPIRSMPNGQPLYYNPSQLEGYNIKKNKDGTRNIFFRVANNRSNNEERIQKNDFINIRSSSHVEEILDRLINSK